MKNKNFSPESSAGEGSQPRAPEVVDERLICSRCGELGTVKPDRLHAGYLVACKRGRQLCCITRCYPTEAEAIARWERFHVGALDAEEP